MDSYIETPQKVKKSKAGKKKPHEKGEEKVSVSQGSDLIAEPNQNLIESHPKSLKLVELLKDYFQETSQNINQKSIIFTQNRNSASELKRLLNTSDENLFRAEVFIGQANSDGNGMNQKVQIETINSFKKGIYNILVATCIGEEGLDIGEVDLIICYDSGFSPIRMIQRMGRTGRQRAGKVFILLMEGKEYQSYVQSQKKHRELNQLLKGNCLTDKQTSKSIECEENNAFTFFDSNPRMVPNETNPICRIIDGAKDIEQEMPESQNLAKNDSIQPKQQSPGIRKSRSSSKKNIASNNINMEIEEEQPITIATLVVDPILSIPQQHQPEEFIQYQWQSPELSSEDHKNEMEEEEFQFTINKKNEKQVKSILKQPQSPEEQKSIQSTRDQFEQLQNPSEKDAKIGFNEQKQTIGQSDAIGLFSGLSEKLINKKTSGEAIKLNDKKNNQTVKVPLKRSSGDHRNIEKKVIEKQNTQDDLQRNQFEETEVTFLKKYNPNSIFVNIEQKKGKIKKKVLDQRLENSNPATPAKEKKQIQSQSIKTKSPQNLYQHSHIPRSLYPNFMSLQQSPPSIQKNQERFFETPKTKDFSNFGSDSDSLCGEEEIMKLVKQLGSKQPQQAGNGIQNPNSTATPNPFCLEFQKQPPITCIQEQRNNFDKISIKTEEQPNNFIQKECSAFENQVVDRLQDKNKLLKVINTPNKDLTNNVMQVFPKSGQFENKTKIQNYSQNDLLNAGIKLQKNQLSGELLKANEIPSPPKKKPLYQLRNEQFKKDLEKEFNAEEWAQREKNKIISEPLTDPKMIRAQKAKKQISAAQMEEEKIEIVEKGLSAKKAKELEDANSFIKPFENLFLLLEGDSSESEEVMKKQQLGKSEEISTTPPLSNNIFTSNPNKRKENPYSYLQSSGDNIPTKRSKPITFNK